MLIFFFFVASALPALHLYNEPKFMVIGNPVILEQSHANNTPDLRDRGSIYNTKIYQVLLIADESKESCTGARRTKTYYYVAPSHVDASSDSYFILSERAAWGGGGGRFQTFSFVPFSLFSGPRAILAFV